MKISVAICTWNRGVLLQRTLENFCNILIPDGILWELLIINNNSTDNTDEVIDRFQQLLPIKKYFEPQPGLSNARNKAVEKATGDYIIWTDDDVIVAENWIFSYIKSFKHHPEAVLFGGPISPWFEGEPPRWLREGWAFVQSCYAIRALGPKEFMFNKNIPSQFPYGANFALRMDIQSRYRYDPQLGLNAGKIILGEEISMMLSIMHAGYSGWWVPDAKVKHWLTTDRQKFSYIRKYYEGLGYTEFLKDDCSKDVRFLGYPRWLYREFFTALMMFILHSIVLKNNAIAYWGKMWRSVGKFKGFKQKIK